MDYSQHFKTTETPQSEPIPGSTQVPNSAGGFAWAVDDWVRLDRFLILGSEGGTYYIGERKLTQENAQGVLRCLKADGTRTVARIVEISEAGRAPKNDPAIFALAMAAGLGDPATRRAALEALPRVCRIGTHLFHFVQAVEGFRRWGRGLRRAIQRWYSQPVDQVAYQAVKYRQRDGWTHADLLRLAHVVPASPAHQDLFHWITGAKDIPLTERTTKKGIRLRPYRTWLPEAPRPAHPLVAAFQMAQSAPEKEVCRLIREAELPREAIPPERLNSPEVWQALLEKMPMTAMIRSLAKMTAVGILDALGPGAAHVCAELGNVERLRKARVHPIALLAALTIYRQGHGERGALAWTPTARILDALDAAFYAAFGAVTPTGKRLMLALDVSGSMASGAVSGVSGLTPRVASAALALVTAAVEPNHVITCFAAGKSRSMHSGYDTGIAPCPISPRQRLEDAVRVVSEIPFGGTDCALPMLYATEKQMAVDAFLIYTDNETWAGNIHPAQALRRYRQQSGIPAKCIVVGMRSNGFSTADPDDRGMLDVVGFDTAVPQLMADFIA